MNKRYFVTGNTAQGFVNYLDLNLQEIDRVLILKHESSKVKTSILKSLIKYYNDEQQADLEILLSSLGSDYLDGIIIRNKSLAIIDDRLKMPQLKYVTTIDVSTEIEEIDDRKLVNTIKKNIKKSTQLSYDQFAKGLKIHDQLEAIYINEMNFPLANKLADELINHLLAKVTKTNRKPLIYKRLFGTNTPEGAINIVPELISKLENVYFIKGRAGTGKSTFMKKVLQACYDYGFDIELYHCSFDSKSIDMVVVPELSFAIFDSTLPHEFFPEKDNHHVIDMYKETVTDGTDEKYSEEISAVTLKYKHHMKKGIEGLKEADLYLKRLESMYQLNGVELEKVTNQVIKKGDN